MRGWVYIFTNKAMPGLIKIGFTLKDPDSRAKELDHTGVPHSYTVEYEVLTHNPRDIEQQVHRMLSEYHDRKEWFRCDIFRGVSAIQSAAQGKILLENYRNFQSAENLNDKSPPFTSAANCPEFHEPVKNRKEPQSLIKTEPSKKPQKRIQFSSTYSNHCQHCNKQFTVTVTRHDRGAYCPECNQFNNLEKFIEKTFK